ncbi:hypothetical protein JHK87_022388 [Glycine soja]|nr:hypothetical protein JHK87_022388 [Glycine soja]
MAFEPGSAVEVSIDGGAGALGRSWFSDRFLVLYPNVAEKSTIDVWLQFSSGKAITAWLQVPANVNILALCVHAIRILHLELSNPISMKAQPPNFARLELLIVKQQVSATISNKKINTVLEYLLQNTPMAYKVDIIHKQHLFK